MTYPGSGLWQSMGFLIYTRNLALVRRTRIENRNA
jgi:hypothetical protein